MKKYFQSPLREKQISGLGMYLQKRPITGQHKPTNAPKKSETHQSCTRPPQKDA
jgi:hypothetical protein